MVVIQSPWGKKSKTLEGEECKDVARDSSSLLDTATSEKITSILSKGGNINLANTGELFRGLFTKAIFPEKLQLFVDDISPIKERFFQANPRYTETTLLREMRNTHQLEIFQLFELENIAEKTFALQINRNPKYFLGVYLELLERYTSK